MPPAPSDVRGGVWRRCLRCLLVVFLLVVAALVGTLVYLRTIGLPPWLRARLERELHAHGYAVQLGQVRLRGFSMLELRNPRLTLIPPSFGASVRAGQMIFRFNREALKQGRFELREIAIDHGYGSWTLAASNAPAETVTLEDFAARLQIPSRGHWELTQCTGRLLNSEFHATASVTNALAVRTWWPRSAQPKYGWQTQLSHALESWRSVQWDAPPQITLAIQGDGKDPHSFHLDASVGLAGARWKSGTIENVSGKVEVLPGAYDTGETKMALEFHFDRAETPWGQVRGANGKAEFNGSLTNLTLGRLGSQLQLASFRDRTLTGRTVTISTVTTSTEQSKTQFRTELLLDAAWLQTPWAAASTNHGRLQILHGLKTSDPWEAHWDALAGPLETRWGKAEHAHLSGYGRPRSRLPGGQTSDASWGAWRVLEPYDADCDMDVESIRAPNLQLDRVACAAVWRAPELALRDFTVALYGGHFSGTARLNVPSREVQAQSTLDFDARQISPLLTETSQRWLSQFDWNTPPLVSGQARLVLPTWTNAQPSWRAEVMPTIQLAGEFSVNHGAFRKVPVEFARSHFTLTNLVWRLPDLYVRRPDSEGRLEYTGDMLTHEFHWVVDAALNPSALKPLFQDERANRVLQDFVFTKPPLFEGEVWGRWREPSTVRCKGHLAATNFTFRGESCDQFQADLAWADWLLNFSNVLVVHEAEQIKVPSGMFDVTERVVSVTNALSTMAPARVTKVIGPKVYAAFQPYQFPIPPTVRINGRLPTLDVADADVRFEVVGETFHYWKLNASNVTGDVFWKGESLSITNVQATVYGGDLAWHGSFDFSVPVGAHLQFKGRVIGANLHTLMVDLGKTTNKLEGSLDGQLTITSANSDDWRSWQGSGHVQLRHGFLWEIPIFGFFSPVLNTMVPGLGNSPISEGNTTFIIDQSVIETKDLELKSPALRLLYTGTVDFQGAVDSRMQAQILRDAWGVGRAISLMLWPLSKAFEYHITGTVYHPKSEPVYIPRMLLWPLHPFRTLKQLLFPKKTEPAAQPASGGIFLPEPS